MAIGNVIKTMAMRVKQAREVTEALDTRLSTKTLASPPALWTAQLVLNDFFFNWLEAKFTTRLLRFRGAM